MKQKRYYIEVLKAGQWRKTWWTGHPDDPDIKSATLRRAKTGMRSAIKRFPKATYRMVEALEETMTS